MARAAQNTENNLSAAVNEDDGRVAVCGVQQQQQAPFVGVWAGDTRDSLAPASTHGKNILAGEYFHTSAFGINYPQSKVMFAFSK